MFSDVKKRLKMLGLTNENIDDIIKFCIAKVAERIKNNCNTPDIPKGLHFVAVDMVCGEVLLMLKATGQLLGFDVEYAVSRIKEGDTDIAFDMPDKLITFDDFVDTLINGRKDEFAKYRRLVW